MDKEKILKKVNRKSFAPNAKYLAGRYDRKYKNKPIYILTDSKGKPYDVVEGEEKALEMLKNKTMDEEFKVHVDPPTTKKDKSQLKKLKEDPEYLRGELDKLYLDYDKKKASLQDYLDEEGMLPEDITEKDPVHAKARKLQNQLKSTTFKLNDKAKLYSGITGEH